MSDTKNSQVLPNAIRLAGDVMFLPGTSLIVDGDLRGGGTRALLGVAAGAMLGPIGWLAVAADSYTKSTTGVGLLERIREKRDERRAERRAERSAAPATPPLDATLPEPG
jgi:hypothetical protein